MADMPPEASCLKFRDSVQELYNKDGGHLDEWIPATHGYLIVNGMAISTPDATTIKSMSRPEKNSLDVSLSLHCTSTDFSSCHFKMYARGLGLEDECVAQMPIWMTHIQQIGVEYQDAKDALEQFGPGP